MLNILPRLIELIKMHLQILKLHCLSHCIFLALRHQIRQVVFPHLLNDRAQVIIEGVQQLHLLLVVVFPFLGLDLSVFVLELEHVVHELSYLDVSFVVEVLRVVGHTFLLFIINALHCKSLACSVRRTDLAVKFVDPLHFDCEVCFPRGMVFIGTVVISGAIILYFSFCARQRVSRGP